MPGHQPIAASSLPELGPDAYRRWRASEVGAITERLERSLVLELIGDVAGRRVLDVGCGDGTLAIELARRGATVTGIDASEAMIVAAKEKASQSKADVSFEVGEAAHLPFQDGQFDLVTAITFLCFVADATPVFRETSRVLRPGGRFVIGELGKWSTWAAARRVRAWLGSPLWRMGRFRTEGELRELAAKAGLAVESVRGAIYYPRWSPAARLVSRFDSVLGRVTTIGAGFIAISTIKPEPAG